VSELVVIDNGGGNVASVRFALERLGVVAVLTTDAARVAAAARVILPGVGAARDAMQRLAASGLDRLIPTLRQPLLGICLGMQLLFEASDEGSAACLGVIKGVARRLDPAGTLPVPHMGWNQLEPLRPSPLLAGIGRGAYAYFVHSYALAVGPDTLATCDYGGPFTAVVSRGNFHGVQFHPERSAATGARLLANFLSLEA
jgi:imidazole glycerol-phosphate synthase subunit HisH